MDHPRGQLVLGIGEILWDCFDDGRRPGGAPANVVFHVTRLHRSGLLCSRVGTDVDGDALLAVLRERGLDLRLVRRDPGRATGRVSVDTSRPDAPRFTIHENAAWDAIELGPELEQAARECAALCVGTLAQRTKRSRDTIRRCLELARSALTVYDVNLRPPFYRREWIEATLERVRVVKLNDDEVRVLDDLLELRAGDETGFARSLIGRFGLEWVCVTRGARGCLMVSADEVHDEAGVPVRVIDAVGAGDAFTAGMISGLLRGDSAAEIARSANRLGAAVAARAGAMPDIAGPPGVGVALE